MDFPTQCRLGRARGVEAGLDVSAQLASRLATKLRPAIFWSGRGRRASADTRRTIERAESRQAGAGAVVDVAGIQRR